MDSTPDGQHGEPLAIGPGNTDSPAFVFTRSLHEGESLAGFVQWLCAENVVPRQAHLFKLLARFGCTPPQSIWELAQDDGALSALERLARQPVGGLAHLRLRVLRAAVDDGEEDRIVQHGYEWPQGSLAKLMQPVCTHCLREDGFVRAEWEFVQAPVCTRHSLQLIENCGACGAPIRSDRPTVAHCASCSASLTDLVATPANALVVTAAHAIQAPRMLAFGSESYTVPVEPQDLSGLLRLLLLPRFGEDVSYGLHGDLEAIPLARRIEALHRLGACIVGKRLDAERVRQFAQQRWPYASRLVADEQWRLLLEAGRIAGLAPDITRVLGWNNDAAPYPMAIEVFDKRPPRILSLAQLAAHLRLEPENLAALLNWEPMATNKLAHLGFDMDEVLRLERVLRSMLTVEQVDELLGWPGATAELVKMRLLEGLPGPEGTWRIYARSLSQLLARVHERVGTVDSDAGDWVSLQSSRELGFDARQFAWAIAQVIGGSLVARSWEPPFGLTSLFVCRRRLRELASWPQSEAPAQTADGLRSDTTCTAGATSAGKEQETTPVPRVRGGSSRNGRSAGCPP